LEHPEKNKFSISSYHFSSDGKKLLVVLEDQTILIWSLLDRELFYKKNHPNIISSIIFSLDNKKLIIENKNNFVELHAIKRNLPKKIVQSNRLSYSKLSPSGKYLLSYEDGLSVYVVNTGQKLYHFDEISSPSTFSQDEK